VDDGCVCVHSEAPRLQQVVLHDVADDADVVKVAAGPSVPKGSLNVI